MEILELCSEDAHNSWTFWSSQDKTEAELIDIVQTIDELIREKKLVALESQSNGTFAQVPFSLERLKKEVRQSMISDNSSETLYWFSATDDGKEEDRLKRGVTS